MPTLAVEVIPPAELTTALLAVTSHEHSQPYSAVPRFYLSVAAALNSTPLPLRVSDHAGNTSIVLGRIGRESSRARLGYFAIPLPRLRTYTIIYQGIIGCCEPTLLVHSLAHWLHHTHGIEQIVFTKLPADSDLARHIGGRRRATALAEEAHWRLELPHTFDDVLAQHSGKHRQRLRWERRKLEDSTHAPLQHIVLGSTDDVTSILQVCESIGSHTYHAKVGGMVHQDHVWRTVLDNLAESGSLACHQFRDGPDPIAFVLTAIHEGVTHILAMAHLPEHSRYSPGKHLLLEVIRESCEKGIQWIDYGFGDAQYKQVYGSHRVQELTLLLSSPTPRASIVRYIIGATTMIARTSHRLLGNAIASRVKQRWRLLVAKRTKAQGPKEPGVG